MLVLFFHPLNSIFFLATDSTVFKNAMTLSSELSIVTPKLSHPPSYFGVVHNFCIASKKICALPSSVEIKTRFLSSSLTLASGLLAIASLIFFIHSSLSNLAASVNVPSRLFNNPRLKKKSPGPSVSETSYA